jgi:hypothetical protein
MDIKLRKKHWTEWIVKRLSGNNEVDKETINFGLNNYANEHGSELLNLYGVSNMFVADDMLGFAEHCRLTGKQCTYEELDNWKQ